MLPPAWISAFTVTHSTLRGRRGRSGAGPDYETNRETRLRINARQTRGPSGNLPRMYVLDTRNQYWWWTAPPAAH
ncbi:hypothetical protein GCM10010359_38250 [Streptomyces morookaense]|nr:hypothetical protein GCM10010359_38250 [Streptomyces morookaense]